MLEEDFLNDPYQILGISYHASEQEIKDAFQRKMIETKGSPVISSAYGKIRDETGRRIFKWLNIPGYFREPPLEETLNRQTVECLIKELAFLTGWEMGDEECLK